MRSGGPPAHHPPSAQLDRHPVGPPLGIQHRHLRPAPARQGQGDLAPPFAGAQGPAIGQQITALHPDFDTRTYGKRKLSELVTELKIFESRKGPGNQLQIRRLD